MTEVEELNREFTRSFDSAGRVADVPPERHFQESIHKHKTFILQRLEDTKSFGHVSIYCCAPYPLEIPVPSLEKFIQENRCNFSEGMRNLSNVDVFQNGISVGYFPRAIRPDIRSTIRITLYRDGLIAFDALADTFMAGEGLHGGWLSYELQRHLQLAKAFIKKSGFSKLSVVVGLEHIESLALNSPSSSGLWLEASNYTGPHEPIRRVANLSEIHDHDGDKRNFVMPLVADMMAEVYRIYGQPKVSGLWNADGKLTYVKGLENQR